jgi:hypothetical protein
MSKGEIVTVCLYGGKTAPRRVIADKGKFVVVCHEDEYQSAEADGREPTGIGFPREDVIEQSVSSTNKKAVSSEISNIYQGSKAGD